MIIFKSSNTYGKYVGILTEKEVFQKVADELRITYEAVKAEMHSNLNCVEHLDEHMEECKEERRQ